MLSRLYLTARINSSMKQGKNKKLAKSLEALRDPNVPAYRGGYITKEDFGIFD